MLPGQSPSRYSALFARLLTSLIATAILAIAWEWWHYGDLLRWNTLPMSGWDRAVLMWILVSKTIWPLLLLLAVSALAARAQRQEWSTAIWVFGSGGVFLWLIADLVVQSVTNNHLLTYVSLLLDPESWPWVEDPVGIVVVTLASVATAAGIAALADWAAVRLVARCARRWTGIAGARAICVVGLLLVLGAAGVTPSYRGVSCLLAVERLQATLPWGALAAPLAEGKVDGDAERVRVALNRRLQASFDRQIASLRHPGPVDEQAVALSQTPHVVVFVLESLRRDVWSLGMMPRLAAWAQQGLQLDRHFAGGNCSHLGVFGLLCARSTLAYHGTLDDRTPPQSCVTMRSAGYQCSYFTSCSLDWVRMNEFIHPGAFDHIVCVDQPNVAGDLEILGQLKERLKQAKTPQFVVCFLNSTHYPYYYPDEFATHQPAISTDKFWLWSIKQRVGIRNRYLNAAQFIDHEVADMIAALDPDRHVIAVTGDHGESLFEDGLLSHWGLLSDAQCRTAMAIVGPGVPQMRIAQATTHADLFPTLLHVLAARQVRLANVHGRDLLAGPVDDQALIATMVQINPAARDAHWDAMLVRGEQRLSLRISFHDLTVRSLGYLDREGKYDPGQTADAEDADLWASLAERQFERVAGVPQIRPPVVAERAVPGQGLRR